MAGYHSDCCAWIQPQPSDDEVMSMINQTSSQQDNLSPTDKKKRHLSKPRCRLYILLTLILSQSQPRLHDQPTEHKPSVLYHLHDNRILKRADNHPDDPYNVVQFH